jgi:outer membrane immunogenic protein
MVRVGVLSAVFGAVVLLGNAPAIAGGPAIWTGLYVGAHAGGTWGDVDVRDTTGGVTPGPFSYDVDGAFGGGTVGYNLQYQSFVIGIEGDLGYMDASGAGVIPSSNPAAHQDITLDGGFYSVAAGRLGVAFGDTLIYAKGGWAYYDGEAGQKTTNPGYVTNPTGAFDGWAYGGGIEYMIARSWSIKAEYLHFDFDTEEGDQTSVSDPPIGFVYKNEHDVEVDTVKVGINYKFGARDEPAPLK